jgi:hypothetical protein
VPVRFTVTDCELPPGTSVTELGLTLLMAMLGWIPVPLKFTVCVLAVAPLLLSVKISEVLRLPVADGVNVTLTVQVLPGPGAGVSVAPVQVSALLAKSPAFVPLRMTVEMMRLAVPVLVRVSAWAVLGVLKD